MLKRLSKFKRWLRLDGLMTHMAGISCNLGGFIWTKGYLFHKGDLYGYMAKLSRKETSAGINHGHVVELYVDKYLCEKDGYHSVIVAFFNRGEQSIEIRTRSMQKIVRILLQKLEKLTDPPAKPLIVRVLMHLFQSPTKKQYRKRQKR